MFLYPKSIFLSVQVSAATLESQFELEDILDNTGRGSSQSFEFVTVTQDKIKVVRHHRVFTVVVRPESDLD